jgi:hypothetical protein
MLPTGSRCHKEGVEKRPSSSKSKTKEERGGNERLAAPPLVMDGAILVGRWGSSSVASKLALSPKGTVGGRSYRGGTVPTFSAYLCGLRSARTVGTVFFTKLHSENTTR